MGYSSRVMADGSLTAAGLGGRAWLRPLMPVTQRVVARSARGPLHTAWRLVYFLLARLYVAAIRRGERESAAFLRGSMSGEEFLAGITDIDLVIVVPSDPGLPGRARERVRARVAGTRTRLPRFLNMLFDWPTVHELADLQEISGRHILDFGLRGLQPGAQSVYWGAGADVDKQRWLERPGLHGRSVSWRRIAGADLRPAELLQDQHHRCVVSWLELQNWWRWAVAACLEPGAPSCAYLAVKLIAEPVRIWAWLTRGQQLQTRREALELGAAEFPEEGEVFTHALRLQRSLYRLPDPALATLLPGLVRLSGRLAQEMERRAMAAGWTEVKLLGAGTAEFALPHGGGQASAWATLADDTPRLLPLADWRALLWPVEPDETFALVDGDPGEPEVLAATAAALDRGTYPTLRADGLLVRPAPLGGRSRLRAVHCRPTDPASFALIEAQPSARFPRIRGLSIDDLARRGVAEHWAWLKEGDDGRERPGTILGRLITAARAALLWEGIKEDEPVLPLTAAATMDLLGSRGQAAEGLVASAGEAYHDFALNWSTPGEDLISELRTAVRSLRAYGASEEASLQAA